MAALKRHASICLVPYDRTFLDRSWDWLRDPEIKQLTMTPDFTREDQLAFFDALCRREDYRIWGVAAADGRPIGAAGIKHIRQGSGEVFLYIGERSWWGRGAGQQILQLCEAEARKLGLTRLTMIASQSNGRSIRAFEKSGFTVDGDGSVDGITRMSKVLA
jgi:RimJ/RimL family protein N-acetyltransferase